MPDRVRTPRPGPSVAAQSGTARRRPATAERAHGAATRARAPAGREREHDGDAHRRARGTTGNVAAARAYRLAGRRRVARLSPCPGSDALLAWPGPRARLTHVCIVRPSTFRRTIMLLGVGHVWE
jgi:hypothetical protein